MAMVMKCRAGNGFGGRCQAVAVGNSDRCLDHVGSPEPDCPAPDKVIFSFDGVTEEAFVTAGIPMIVERSEAREGEMARNRKDLGFRGMNPFFQEGEGKDGRMRKNHIFLGRVGGAVAEVLQQGFRIVDAHGLRGEDRRGNEMLTLVVTLAKSGQERDRAFEILGLVAAEAEKVRSFFVCVNPPARDRMTGQMAATHCVVCWKAQIGAPAKTSLRYDGGLWGLEEVAPAPVRK